jgi:hypothetical protein
VLLSARLCCMRLVWCLLGYCVATVHYVIAAVLRYRCCSQRHTCNVFAPEAFTCLCGTQCTACMPAASDPQLKHTAKRLWLLGGGGTRSLTTRVALPTRVRTDGQRPLLMTKGNPSGSRGCHQTVPDQHLGQGKPCQQHNVPTMCPECPFCAQNACMRAAAEWSAHATYMRQAFIVCMEGKNR